jgi:hypothetical protein
MKYVEDNENITCSELDNIFHKSVQGSSGVFSSHHDAEEVFLRTSIRRHFLKPDELVTLTDITIAVSSQWGVGNIDRLIRKAKELGYTVTS